MELINSYSPKHISPVNLCILLHLGKYESQPLSYNYDNYNNCYLYLSCPIVLSKTFYIQFFKNELNSINAVSGVSVNWFAKWVDLEDLRPPSLLFLCLSLLTTENITVPFPVT